MNKQAVLWAAAGLLVFNISVSRADDHAFVTNSFGASMTYGTNTNGSSAAAPGAQLKSRGVISQGQALSEGETDLQFGLGEAQGPDRGRSLAIGTDVAQKADAGWRPSSKRTCSSYFNGGAGYEFNTLGSMADGAKLTAENIGGYGRAGVGLACVNSKFALVMSPFVGLDAELAQGQSMFTTGARARLMLGHSFAGLAEAAYKIGIEDSSGKGKDGMMSIQYLPTRHFALGLDARVTENEYSQKQIGAEARDNDTAKVVTASVSLAY